MQNTFHIVKSSGGALEAVVVYACARGNSSGVVLQGLYIWLSMCKLFSVL